MLRNKIITLNEKELIMPELIIGSPPRGEDYFGQDELIENI